MSEKAFAIKTVHFQPSWTLRSCTVELAVTQIGGHMAPVQFYRNTAAPIQPYYINPWGGKWRQISDPVVRPLRGDFFCMPFGDNMDEYRGEQHVCHGESATARWRLASAQRCGRVVSLTLKVRTKVRPGTITKTLSLIDGHNVVYCRHLLEGYRGAMPLGHHATLAVPETPGAMRLSSSSYRFGSYVFEHITSIMWSK